MNLTPVPPSGPGPAPARPLPPVGPHECRPTGRAAELRVLILRSSRRLRAERTGDVTAGQYAVLAALSADGPLSPGELADREGVRPPSMTRTVAALAQAGLVERTANEADRRQVDVDLTEAGRAVVRETRRRRDAWLARRLAELSPGEREVVAQAVRILARVVAR
jgi:DNA-binding MarR family transcriptional regulator